MSFISLGKITKLSITLYSTKHSNDLPFANAFGYLTYDFFPHRPLVVSYVFHATFFWNQFTALKDLTCNTV